MADLRLLTRVHGFLKLAEIVIAIACLGLLHTYSLNFGGDLLGGSFADRYNVGVITLGGFILVSLPLLIAYLWSPAGTYQPFLEIVYNFTGFILFLTAGALALDHYTRTKNYGYDIHYPGRNIKNYTDSVTWQPTTANYRGENDYTSPGDYNKDNRWINRNASWPYFWGNDTVDNSVAGQAMGALCIVNAFVYLADAILAYRQGTSTTI